MTAKKTKPEALTSGSLLHASEKLAIESLTADELMLAYAAVQLRQKKLDEFRDVLNAKLKDVVRTVGVPTESGHMRFDHEGTAATVEHRVAKVPEEKGLKTLLLKAGLSESEVYDEVKVKQLNPSKLNALIELGKLKAVDVELLKKVTYALTVEPSPALAAKLAEVFEAEKLLLEAPKALPADKS